MNGASDLSVEVFLEDLANISPEFSSDSGMEQAESVAEYDFAFNELLLPPTSRRDLVRGMLGAESLAYLDALEADAVPEPQIAVVETFFLGLRAALTEAAHTSLAPHVVQAQVDAWMASLHTAHGDLLSDLIRYFVLTAANPDTYFSKLTYSLTAFLRQQGFSWLAWAQFEFVVTRVLGISFDDPLFDDLAVGFAAANVGNPQALARGGFEFWIWTRLQKPGSAFAAEDASHPFEVFAPLSVNYGLRRIHRQSWRFLGPQRGELVRTIPLGPGQKERVTTKILRRRKIERSRESMTERTTEKETVDTTKDSSELVEETASTFNWNVSADVNASFGVIGGSVSSSLGGTSEERSKTASAHMNEFVEKVASKLRRETKVIVRTEGESSFEEERASEIQNENKEVAVTYEYRNSTLSDYMVA